MKKYHLLLLILLSFSEIYSQSSDFQIGSTGLNRTSQGAYFDYSDPGEVNMTVSVWGFVRFPGRYLIPSKTSVSELLSYAGGPSENAELDELRLYRTLLDSTQILLKFNYDDVFWNDQIKNNKINVPDLQIGDILVVPGSDKLYFDDWLRLGLSVVGTAVSVITFIIVTNNN